MERYIWAHSDALGGHESDLACLRYSANKRKSKLSIDAKWVFDPGTTSNIPGVFVDIPDGVVYEDMVLSDMASISDALATKTYSRMATVTITIDHYHTDAGIALAMADASVYFFVAAKQRLMNVFSDLKQWVVKSTSGVIPVKEEGATKSTCYMVKTTISAAYQLSIDVTEEAPILKTVELAPSNQSI
ncbi:MAG: hypothetical protein RR182_00550 [Alistipes sp.]